MAAPPALAERQAHNIVFRIFGPGITNLFTGPGPGTMGVVSYRNLTTRVDDRLVPLPWTLTFQAKGDDAALARQLRLSLTRPDPEEAADGVYACEISVDGELREREEGDLETGSLQCSLNNTD